MEASELYLDENVSINGLMSPDVVLLDRSVSRTSRMGGQNEGILMLEEATSSHFNPLKRVAEREFEISVESRATIIFFPMTTSYFRRVPEA